jgi:hypothetical protein
MPWWPRNCISYCRTPKGNPDYGYEKHLQVHQEAQKANQEKALPTAMPNGQWAALQCTELQPKRKVEKTHSPLTYLQVGNSLTDNKIKLIPEPRRRILTGKAQTPECRLQSGTNTYYSECTILGPMQCRNVVCVHCVQSRSVTPRHWR